MIEVRNVTKSYGPLTVLHDISLEIHDREIMAIVGPSGAGKTTLLQIAGSLDRPDSGKVIFDNTDIFSLKDRKLSEFRNRNIGFVFQFHQLLPEFSSLENVAMPALIAGKRKKEAFSEAERLLSELGLSDRLRHKPAQLSGGEKQRTAIARALINRPRIVFADEPTGSLDSHNREEIQDIFTSLRDSMHQSFVIVTHDPHIADIADRKIIMADGRIVEEVSTSNIPDLTVETENNDENTQTESLVL